MFVTVDVDVVVVTGLLVEVMDEVVVVVIVVSASRTSVVVVVVVVSLVAVTVEVGAVTVVVRAGFQVQVKVGAYVVTVFVHPTDVVNLLGPRQFGFLFLNPRSSTSCNPSGPEAPPTERFNERPNERLDGPPNAPL